MQNLKIYILIKDTSTDESLNMDGNFEIFKSFLYGLNRSLAQADPAPITALPVDGKPSEGENNATH